MTRTWLGIGIVAVLLAGPLVAQNTAPLFVPAQRTVDVPHVHEYGWVVSGDFDGKKGPDVLLASSFASPRLLLNNGKGTLADGGSAPSGKEDTVDNGVAVGDIDGDGDPDLVIARNDWAGRPGPLDIWINDGHAHFTDDTAARIATAPECRPVGLVDVDADGDLDLVCGRTGAQNMLFLNDGSGFFTDVTATHMPVDTDDTFCLAFGDLDGDGDIDMALGNWLLAAPHEQQDRVYLNDGAGVFTVAVTALPATPLQTRGITLIDWEGDGDQDLVLALGNHYGPEPDKLYLNDGTGTFIEQAGALPSVARGSRTFRTADIDGDGDLDLFAPGTEQSYLLRNDGGGTWADVTTAQLPPDPENRNRTATFADTDRDGDPDLVYATGNGLLVLRNDGAGTFSTWFDPWMPFAPASAEGVAFGDVDGDGDEDMAVASYPLYPDFSYQNKLWLNDGRGRYTDATAQLPPDGDASTAAAFSDVDGDGDLDLLFANEGPTRLYLNDGTGYFTPSAAGQMPPTAGYSYGLELGDVDGDGDEDIVLANAFQPDDYLFLNDGSGFFTDFTAAQLPNGNDNSRGVELADVDGDGDLDILFGNGFYTSPAGEENRLLLNDGGGFFADAPAGSLPAISDETMDVVMGDVDGDGDLDFYEANGYFGTSIDRLYINDGSGVFTDSPSRLPPLTPGRVFSALLRDFDGDGDLDIHAGKADYLADTGDQNALYLNDGTGHFIDGAAALPRSIEHVNWLAAADVDGDCDLDLVSVGYYEPVLYLNLTRQVWAPEAAVSGSNYSIEIHARPADAAGGRMVIPMVSLAPASVPGCSGILGLDPASMRVLGRKRTDPDTAMVTKKIKIGNGQPLFGAGTFYVQALVHEGGASWQLTNTLEEFVLP